MSSKIEKGGEGSGIRNHVTNHPDLHTQKVQNLATELGNKNPFAAHLHMLKNGAVMEGVNLRSGKPLFLNHEQAIAHGYTPEEHREAGNIHYERAQKISDKIQQVRDLKRQVPPEMSKIVDFHRQQFRRHFNAADRVERTRQSTEIALEAKKKKLNEVAAKVKKSEVDDFVAKASKRIKPEDADRCVRNLVADGADLDLAYAKCSGKRQGMSHDPLDKCDCDGCKKMAKSVVMMGHQDAAEIDTAKFAMERKAAMENDWLQRFMNVMDGYAYGDVPRVIMLDTGDLVLVKVEEGLYTGFYREVVNTPDGPLVDNAKVRLERMTMPSLINFAMAKNWIKPYLEPDPVPVLEPIAMESVAHKLSMPMPEPIVVDHKAERAIKLLELIHKLVN